VQRVGAIIASFNPEPALLRGAVESCLGSPLVGRVVVVDDGSEPAVLIEAGERVEVVRQENRGPSAARNRGLDGVEEEFALLLDHDDALIPEGLAAMVALAERTGSAAVVAARIEERGGERRLREAPREWRERVLPSPGEVFRPLAIFGASGCLVRGSVVRAGARFDEGLRIGEDREFLRRVAGAGPIAVCSAAAVVVRLHGEGANLSSMAHLPRRVADHLVIMERHMDGSSREPLREQTMWLLGALAKRRPLDVESWARLTGAAREQGWGVPLKARWRAWRGRGRGRGAMGVARG
jgi:glycosyltransferase involved in cell wall biosynthesis